MGMLAWVMMGLALWHFTIWLPDRYWGGIVGAFVGALLGAIVFGFADLVRFGELCVGISLFLGLLTRFGALFGVLLPLSYLATRGALGSFSAWGALDGAVAEDFAEGGALAAAGDEDGAGRLGEDHGGMGEGFMVDELV